MSGIKNHVFHVAGKSFVVEVHYLGHVVSKDGTRSLLDFSTSASGSNGVIILFLETKLVIQEDLIVRGVYHAFKDQLEHGVAIRDNPAIDVLMHIFGTNQIELIKQEIIPSSFHDPRLENNGVAMILVLKPGNATSLVEVLSDFREHFSYTVLNKPAPSGTFDESVARAWMLHKQKPAGLPGRGNHGLDQLVKTASARMALFSLRLQQKN